MYAPKKIPVIGVMGSAKDPYSDKTSRLGHWIAESGYHLLTGGGGGVMSAVSKAFFETENRAGFSIGVIPGEYKDNRYQALADYPNPWIEIPIYTHLPLSGSKGTTALSRNHINILSSNVIVALPGEAGTKSEIILALKYHKPLLGYFKNSFDVFNDHFEIECFESFDNLTSRIKQLLKKT